MWWIFEKIANLVTGGGQEKQSKDAQAKAAGGPAGGNKKGVGGEQKGAGGAAEGLRARQPVDDANQQLLRQHAERPHDRQLAERHLRVFSWCYGGPQVDERLKDEVVVVSAPLLAILVLSAEAAQQVGLWMSTGKKLFLLCTQKGHWPLEFKIEGLKVVLNRQTVTFVDAGLMPGRAIATGLPTRGWTGAYRYHYLLLLPPLPDQGHPPLPRPEVPDADDRDDE